MKSTISSKGQVTVPIEARRALGMRAGTEVEFELQKNGVLLRRTLPAVDPVDRAYGILGREQSTDDYLRELRGPALDELPPRARRRR